MKDEGHAPFLAHRDLAALCLGGVVVMSVWIPWYALFRSQENGMRYLLIREEESAARNLDTLL